MRLGVTAYGKAEWTRLEPALADNAWYTARLLAGEMPEDIDEMVTGLGVPLFPAVAGDLSMDYSCPDEAVPCKHIAAVCYLHAFRRDLADRPRRHPARPCWISCHRSSSPSANGRSPSCFAPPTWRSGHG